LKSKGALTGNPKQKKKKKKWRQGVDWDLISRGDSRRSTGLNWEKGGWGRKKNSRQGGGERAEIGPRG